MAAPMFAGNAGPWPVQTKADGSIRAFSSFGPEHTTTGPEYETIDAEGLYNSERVGRLRWKQSFYKCTQHDMKLVDFDGRMLPKEAMLGVQPLIGGNLPSQYVPLSGRRPSAPYRLARTIVKAFTGMLFGQNRWPQLRSEDPATQDFCEELVRVMRLRTAFVRGRNLGGSSGTVGISWAIRDGKPRVRVHPGYTIHALDWLDPEEFLPSYVVELYQFERDVYDAEKRQNVKVRFWHRRDWTPEADIVFKPTEVNQEEPVWQVDEEQTNYHGDGFLHFVWIVNVPEEEPGEMDGVDDYAECYEQMNSIDILNSVSVRGTTLNLDPTLKLKMEKEDVQGAVIKGSDNAIITGRQGDADYMQLNESSVGAGKTLLDHQREQVLEVSQCVVLDPDKAAAQGMSSVAMKTTYSPMLGMSDIHRETYGQALERLLQQICESVRRLMPDAPNEQPVDQEFEQEIVDEAGNPTGEFEVVVEPVVFELDLEPRVEKKPVVDEHGKATGEFEVIEHVRHPGTGTIKLEWGEYFPPTSDDKTKAIQATSTAVGAKPVLSQQSGVEIAATLYNRDPQREQLRIEEEQQRDLQAQAGMFPPIGGEVGGAEQLPGGALPLGQAATTGEEVDIGVENQGIVTLVNEARGSKGPLMKLGPDGKSLVQDPDGFLTVAAFKAKTEAMAKAMAAVWAEGASAQIQAKNPPEPDPAQDVPPPGATVPPPTQPSGGPP